MSTFQQPAGSSSWDDGSCRRRVRSWSGLRPTGHLSLLLSLAMLATPAPESHAAEPATAKRPNLLFIITDQQAGEALGCAGNAQVRTPNMDRLAARGVRFTQSYCTFPLCTPARASLFTSLMPHRTGITGNDLELAGRGFPTMGDFLKEAGYDTAYAGKWHVAVGYPGMTGKPIPGFSVLPQPTVILSALDLDQHGKGLTVDGPVADAAIAYLRQRHDRPFLLVASLLNPHDICEFPRSAALRKLLPDDPARLPPLRINHADTEPLPSTLTKSRKYLPGRSELEWRQYLWVYFRLVEQVDAEIGRILDALQEQDLDTNTVIVLTSDHGDMMGAHRFEAKTLFYEEAANVPLIIVPPGASARTDTRHLASGVDILPTLLDYAGALGPDRTGLDGRSLRPLIEDRAATWRDHLVVTNGMNSRMLRTARFKYIRFATGKPSEQFFDLASDRAELRNLAEDPALASELAMHRDLLDAWMTSQGDDINARNPPRGAATPATSPRDPVGTP